MTDTIPTPGDEDDDNDADGEVPNEYFIRRFIPHIQISSFTSWHQDRRVDKGRDEYCMTLTELSHEVNKPSVSFWRCLGG